jgi:hypothetical protein
MQHSPVGLRNGKSSVFSVWFKLEAQFLFGLISDGLLFRYRISWFPPVLKQMLIWFIILNYAIRHRFRKRNLWSLSQAFLSNHPSVFTYTLRLSEANFPQKMTHLLPPFPRNRHSSVSIVMGYGLDGQVLFPAVQDFSLLHNVQIGSRTPILLSNKYRGSSPEGKLAAAWSCWLLASI